jgi:two-component system sensor histidine kinase UhpB
MSLKVELIISIALAVVATFLIASAMLYVHAIEKVETEIEAAIAVGGRIATNAVDDVEEITNPRRRLELLVADFDGDRHLRASVWHSLGNLLMTSRVAQPDEPPPDWFYDLLAGEPRAVTVNLPPAFDGHGTLVLETNARNEVGEVWQDTVNLLSIVLIMCGIIVAAVSLIVGRALRPLGRLADALTRIGGRREPERLEERGPIEFVRVYRGFNQMVERLAHAEAVNRALNEQLLSVQEEERADVARDLHDEIGPFLFAVDVDATSIKKMVEERRYQEIPERVKSVREAVGHMQAHVKGILARLRPAFLLDLGLAHALENHISFLRGRHRNVALELDIEDEGFGKELDATIYRVVQESLSNAIRHGGPSHVLISVRQEGEGVRVIVRDDGRGLPETTTNRSGFGILGMKERVAAHNGSLEVMNRKDGRGVVVSGWLPFSEDELDDLPREVVLESSNQ